MAIWEQQLPESPWMKLGFLPPLLLLLLLLIHLLQIFFYFRGLVRMLFWLQPVIMTSSNVSSKYLGQWKARKYLGQRVSSLWRRPDPRAFRSLLGLRSGACSAPQDPPPSSSKIRLNFDHDSGRLLLLYHPDLGPCWGLVFLACDWSIISAFWLARNILGVPVSWTVIRGK